MHYVIHFYSFPDKSGFSDQYGVFVTKSVEISERAGTYTDHRFYFHVTDQDIAAKMVWIENATYYANVFSTDYHKRLTDSKSRIDQMIIHGVEKHQIMRRIDALSAYVKSVFRNAVRCKECVFCTSCREPKFSFDMETGELSLREPCYTELSSREQMENIYFCSSGTPK